MPNILIMAGGTGGHIYPGLAVAHRLKQDNWDINWLGTADKMEARIVPEQDIPFHTIKVKGIRGNGLLRKIVMPVMLCRAVFDAYRLIKRIKPDIVLGMGGYASGPGGIAAKFSSVPLIIHEQNAIAGMTNRYLAKIASHVCSGFPHTDFGVHQDKVTYVGNPVRAAIAAIPDMQEKPQTASLKLLVFGGSLGARIFNQTLPKILHGLSQSIPGLNITHQVGKGNLASVQNAYSQYNFKADVTLQVTEFIDDIAAEYAQADMIICRAGASSVAEIAAAGRVACFVPLPSAVDDHQTANAEYLTKADAGRLCPQANLAELAQYIMPYLTNSKARFQAAKLARQLSKSDATEQVCFIIKGLLDE
jgi:UDP-N-acetylglucosamine--N-acetylmuramyl-(pentapeptide) pyrophosphoryl-undecaprenol N-acetylglucosamine transferase